MTRARCVFLSLTFFLTALCSSSYATTTVLDWAYRCTDNATVVYIAVRTTSLPRLDFELDSANLLLTPQGNNTQQISLNDSTGFRTNVLTGAEFDALNDAFRAGLESNDSVIHRWVEVTIPPLTDGDQYSFSAFGPRLSTPVSNSWVTVIDCGDDTPPVLITTVGETMLWPPDHRLINPGLELLELSDDQDMAPSVDVFIYSDEDLNETGDGNTAEDATDTNFGTLNLRAERSGTGDGRVYLIVAVATDASGNESVTCHTVVVPRSMSRKDRESIADQATLAEWYCDDEESLISLGFTLIGTSVDF